MRLGHPGIKDVRSTTISGEATLLTARSCCCKVLKVVDPTSRYVYTQQIWCQADKNHGSAGTNKQRPLIRTLVPFRFVSEIQCVILKVNVGFMGFQSSVHHTGRWFQSLATSTKVTAQERSLHDQNFGVQSTRTVASMLSKTPGFAQSFVID